MESLFEVGLFHFCCSDDYVVRVKAQVMTRDDSTGGWVPMGGGGMSIVGLRKLVISTGDDIHHEYLIHGERIADQSVSSIHQSLSSSCGKELTKLPINM